MVILPICRLRLGIERRVLGEIAQQRLRQQRHVARGRDLLLGGQPVRIDEMRVQHAELAPPSGSSS